MIASRRVNVFNVHWLPGIIFTGLTVFAASGSALIYKTLGRVPGQLIHEQSGYAVLLCIRVW